MWTIEYKPGYYIHGYCDKPACKWQGPDYVVHHVCSLRVAKEAIRKAIKAL